MKNNNFNIEINSFNYSKLKFKETKIKNFSYTSKRHHFLKWWKDFEKHDVNGTKEQSNKDKRFKWINLIIYVMD